MHVVTNTAFVRQLRRACDLQGQTMHAALFSTPVPKCQIMQPGDKTGSRSCYQVIGTNAAASTQLRKKIAFQVREALGVPSGRASAKD